MSTHRDDAPDSALHDRSVQAGREVQLARTRAGERPPLRAVRDGEQSVAQPGTVRGAVAAARTRFATVVGSPGSREKPSPGSAGPETRLPVALRLWADDQPCLQAVWRRLCERAPDHQDRGWLAACAYWLFGLVGFLVAVLARVVGDASSSPGRFAALLAVCGLAVGGLLLAGLI